VRHRRPRKPLLSPTALVGAALGASLVAGAALGTAAAAHDSHRAHGRSLSASAPRLSTATDADSADLQINAVTSAADTSGTAGTGTASATGAVSATGAAGTGTASATGAVSATGAADHEPAPGKVVPVRIAVGGAIAADAAHRKTRPAPEPKAAAVKTTPDWVNPNPAAVVTSCFGQRWGRLHAGVDLAAPDGTPIVAAGAGVVVRAGLAEGYGNAVLIDHGNGFLTHYGHLSQITVVVGQHVAAGQPIGAEGSTGHSTGPHLHFEVHQGYYQNPIEPTAWMREHGVDIPGC
jgi:murein DD-endopeptidase MepM/ murein hydrolase activator NlpD